MLEQSIRVLVVDGMLERDDHIDDILVNAGFATRVVNDSVSATGALEVWGPSVAVIDLRSPAGEARRFGATLAARTSQANVPVILVGEGPNLLKWLPVVPAGLVPTPVDAEHLVATLTRVARDAMDARRTSLASR